MARDRKDKSTINFLERMDIDIIDKDWNIPTEYPDDEHRAFYVGVTRTKKNLHILESAKKYRYEI